MSEGERIRMRVDLAYDGTDFHGWARQPGQRTVQGELAAALERLLARRVVPVGAGRTDAGVHARGQVCSFDVRDDREAARVARGLPGLAPRDVQVLAVRRAEPGFSARFSAVARRYAYHLLWGRDVFRARYAVTVAGRLDREAMEAAAALVPGERDFTSLAKAGTVTAERGGRCAVDLCRFEWRPDSAILHVRADRFLHNMVRVLAGTLVETGLGRRRPEDLAAVLAARDRRLAGRTMPPRGLFLEEVSYPAAPSEREET